MNSKQTLEIITKYIGEKYDIKVILEPDVHPHADVKARTIWLPSNVTEESIFPALALAIHEASHIKHTNFDPEKIVSSQEEFAILNAMEDVRIDKKAFNLLPNIKDFYTELFEYVHKEPNEGTSVEARAICNCIKRQEGMYQFLDYSKEVVDLENKIATYFREGVSYLEWGMFDKVKEIIKQIMDIFQQNKPPQPPPQPAPQESKEEKKEEKPEEKKGEASAQGEQKEEPKKEEKQEEQKAPAPEPAQPEQKSDLKEQIERGMYGSKQLKTDGTTGSSMRFEAEAITNATRARFEELLKTKEEKLRQTDSGNLNTDNLTAFLTGNLDELFSEIRIQQPKKSKILILLDMSGSMRNKLLDGNTRAKTVAESAKAIIQSIERVNQDEGVCIDWDIAGFNYDYQLLNKENWESEYKPRGGTDIEGAIERAQQFFEKSDVDGNKIIILITDGQVLAQQIQNMKASIIRKGTSIKMVIVGVGADPSSSFCKEIIDQRNILVKGMANQVLFEALTVALD